jgi:sugar phosphate isomerase/epimerase
MDKSWDGICKVGIVQFMIYPAVMKGEGPVVETITKIATDEFFGAMEITHVADPEARKQVANIVATAHMAVGYGAQPVLLSRGLNLNHLEEVERMKAVETIIGCVDEAVELGIDKVAFLSGRDPGEADRERAFGLLVDSITRICEYAKGKGVSIILETFDYDIDKCALIGPAPLAARLAETVKARCDNFGLMYDLSHVPILHENALEALTILKPHLVHIHVGNAQYRTPGVESAGDQHPRFGLPGSENDVDELVDFLRALFKIGYLQENPTGNLPVVAFEVKPLKTESPEVVLANTKRVWKEAWARV